MSKHHSFYDTVDQIISYGIDKGILHLHTGIQEFKGTEIIVNEKPIINFGSCSYLGLEFEPELKTAAIAAINKYGTQFSASRAYISLGLYDELQALLDRIFEAYCVITPTTTLGHIANIPVLIGEEDAVIMDQQVHNSVQTAVQIVKSRGVHTELVRHNRMDLLEERILALKDKHKKIWYLADGIYSMFGDPCPVDEIYHLLDKYPEFHFYVDDAHGMSIHGKYGRGYVLSNHPIHKKMALVSSLNKAFASGGGVLVFGDPELARKVGTVGGPLLSSGPMQPSGLGAAIASAKIHLSDKMVSMQEQLQLNIQFTIELLRKYKLPLISKAGAAIFFVGVSLPKLGHNLVKRMMDKGFYVNLGVFPTVPMKQTGIRFTITRLHTHQQIEQMIKTLAAEFPLAMQEESVAIADIYKAFKLSVPDEIISIGKSTDDVAALNRSSLKIEHHDSIKKINKSEWDNLFINKGTFDWNGLQLLEESFVNNQLPEDNWQFDYVLIRDCNDKPVIASFFTTALWKDDMLSPAAISAQVEMKRISNPYYLTSKVICSGSLLTEGEHIYIDFNSPYWQEGFKKFFEMTYLLQETRKANHIILRDFHGINAVIDQLMVDNGFFRISMPNSNIVPALSWQTPQEFYQTLSINGRNHLRKKVLRHSDQFETEIIKVSGWQEEVEHWYALFQNVKQKSLELNTFDLPINLFYKLALDENWETLQLTLRDARLNPDQQPCCMVFSYKTPTAYIPMIIGLDYTHNPEFGIYRQALYQLLLRAKKLGKEKVLLGFSAETEKQKFGAKPIQSFAYMHTIDSYNMEELSGLSSIVYKHELNQQILT